MPIISDIWLGLRKELSVQPTILYNSNTVWPFSFSSLSHLLRSTHKKQHVARLSYSNSIWAYITFSLIADTVNMSQSLDPDNGIGYGLLLFSVVLKRSYTFRGP